MKSEPTQNNNKEKRQRMTQSNYKQMQNYHKAMQNDHRDTKLLRRCKKTKRHKTTEIQKTKRDTN